MPQLLVPEIGLTTYTSIQTAYNNMLYTAHNTLHTRALTVQSIIIINEIGGVQTALKQSIIG